MGTFGKVISLNDEVVESPKIRKDQMRKIQALVRANADYPHVALNLVREMAKGFPFYRNAALDSETEPTEILLFTQSDSSKMITTYSFSLIKEPHLPIPTLE